VPVLLLCAAGALHAQGSFRYPTGVFDRVKALKPMDYARVYTLSAGGRPLTGKPYDFLRRRTPEEILASGLTVDSGDIAIVTVYLAQNTASKRS